MQDIFLLMDLQKSTNSTLGHNTSPHSNTILSPHRIPSRWKDKAYSKCCCAPQRTLHRKEHIHMLHHLAVKVGDVITATQMVWVVVELHLLVRVAFLEVVLHCSCHYTWLRSLQAAVIAAEALAIHIVVIVLAIVRHCKGSIIILKPATARHI